MQTTTNPNTDIEQRRLTIMLETNLSLHIALSKYWPLSSPGTHVPLFLFWCDEPSRRQWGKPTSLSREIDHLFFMKKKSTSGEHESMDTLPLKTAQLSTSFVEEVEEVDGEWLFFKFSWFSLLSFLLLLFWCAGAVECVEVLFRSPLQKIKSSALELFFVLLATNGNWLALPRTSGKFVRKVHIHHNGVQGRVFSMVATLAFVRCTNTHITSTSSILNPSHHV